MPESDVVEPLRTSKAPAVIGKLLHDLLRQAPQYGSCIGNRRRASAGGRLHAAEKQVLRPSPCIGILVVQRNCLRGPIICGIENIFAEKSTAPHRLVAHWYAAG